ncbi:hypothetical protein niasHT_004184 [Heterodera trifolii]|uniref:Uncharacterized protein n=1 Tax=Heterodera trifolii TaxID=157864 RepID=A0ABD2MDZ7_9BILA
MDNKRFLSHQFCPSRRRGLILPCPFFLPSPISALTQWLVSQLGIRVGAEAGNESSSIPQGHGAPPPADAAFGSSVVCAYVRVPCHLHSPIVAAATAFRFILARHRRCAGPTGRAFGPRHNAMPLKLTLPHVRRGGGRGK